MTSFSDTVPLVAALTADCVPTIPPALADAPKQSLRNAPHETSLQSDFWIRISGSRHSGRSRAGKPGTAGQAQQRSRRREGRRKSSRRRVATASESDSVIQ